MLGELNIELKHRRDERLSYQKTSLFQGVLMEQIDEAYAKELHKDGLKPYSQRITYDGDRLLWQIKTLNRKAYEEIITPLMSEDFNKIIIRHNDIELEIIDKELSVSSYKKLIESYYFGECPRFVRIQFITPTSFKQNEKYIFYPNIKLIFNSLMNKFDSFAKDESIRTEDILEQLVSNVEVIHYDLRSVKFHLEGTRLSAFKGNISVKIHGPQMLVNLAHMLLRFGVYSGVGIKAAIGMGAMEVFLREKGDKNDR